MPSRVWPSRASVYERFAQAIEQLDEWGGLPQRCFNELA